MIRDMKKTAIVLSVIGMAATVSAADFPTFMAGSWSLSSDGVTVEEHWTDARGNLMVGVNRTAKPGGKASFEFLRVEKREGRIAYVAMPGGKNETVFPLKTLTDSRVVFENLSHDFPQRIIYWRDKDRLCARVEGDMGGKAGGEEWCWTRAK
jgi:hypothetical protein